MQTMRAVIQLLIFGRSSGRRGSGRYLAGLAAVVVTALLAAIAGCGTNREASQTTLLPPEFEAEMQALVIGHLVGDPETGCVGLIDSLENKESWGSPVKWPPGIQARTDPIRLIGPDGTVIARHGDIVHVGGGSTHAEALPIPPCTERPSFIAHRIVKVEPKGTPRQHERPPGSWCSSTEMNRCAGSGL
jgi:hypothetical protein